jgi:peptidoglycan/LPS O-acetylase OafA/YrhL
LSPWFQAQWGGSVGFEDLLRHCLMKAGPKQYPLDFAVWSLVHELRLSLLLPLILVASRLLGSHLCLLACVAVSVAAGVYIELNPAAFPRGHMGYLFDSPDLPLSFLISLRFLSCFAVGFWLAIHFKTLSEWLRRGWLRTTFVGLVAVLGLLQANETLMTIGSACALQVVAMSSILGRVFAFSPLAWLGRVSFSLYLVHLPVMLSFSRIFDRVLPAQTTLWLAVAASLLLAEILFRAVEAPSVRAGRSFKARRFFWGSNGNGMRAT